jgi:hypothetical protein
MADSSFARFRHVAGQNLHALPALRPRLAWLEFRRLFGSFISSAVWEGQPATFAAWEQMRVPRASFDALAEWIGDPEMSGLPELLTLPEAYAVLETLHDRILADLRQEIGALAPRSLSADTDAPESLPIGFVRQAAVDTLGGQLRDAPHAIVATLLHGSLADGRIVEGFSDADVLCVVDRPREHEDTFWQAARWLFQINHWLFAVNPCMHHCAMISFSGEFACAAEPAVPSAIVRRGVWRKSQFTQAHYHDGVVESVMAVGIFESYFERHHLFPPDLRHAFDVLWWTSSALILPVLLQQIETGISIYKRDCLEKRTAPLPARHWATLEQVSQVRDALGRWIAARLPPVITNDPVVNPGRLVADYKAKLVLKPSDVRRLGVGERLMDDVRDLWMLVGTRALEIGYRQISAPSPRDSVTWKWARPTTQQPRPLFFSDYERTRAAFLARCAGRPEVRAVFEFGEVGCPGLSDLDFCVVLADSFLGTPADLQIVAFAEDIAYVMDHDPLFVSESMAPQLGAFFPIFATRQLHGTPMELPPSRKFPRWVQAAAITSVNLRKYPGDLDWLLQQEHLRVRTILAFLHSATHIQRCLESFGMIPSSAVAAALALDQALRTRFSAGDPPTDSDIFAAVRACMAYCEPTRMQWAGFWTQAAAQLPENQQYPIPNGEGAVGWLRAELSLEARARSHRADGPTLMPLIADYLAAKERFVHFERGRARAPSVYIEDPDSVQPIESTG